MGYTIVRILQRFSRVQRYWNEDDLTLQSDIVLSPGEKGVRVGFFT